MASSGGSFFASLAAVGYPPHGGRESRSDRIRVFCIASTNYSSICQSARFPRTLVLSEMHWRRCREARLMA